MAALEQRLNANGHPLPTHWKRTIAIIWTGQAASVLATCAATFAVLWYITISTDSALMLSIAGVAALLPAAILSPFGGVAADRYNKKRIMIAADGIAGLFSILLAVLVLAGALSPWLLMLLLVARSAAQGFHGTSLMALMPELVPEEDMVRINTLDQTLTSLSSIAGPVLGILFFNVFGFAAVLFFDGICAALACLCLAIVKLPYARNAHAQSTGVFADLRVGLATIGNDSGIKVLLAMVVLAMLIFLPLGTISPLMTYDWFKGDGFAASIVEAAAGIGLLVGSFGMLLTGGGKRLVPVLVGSGCAIGLACIGCGLLPANGFWAFVLLIALIFVAIAIFNAPVLPLMQKRIPQENFGKVMGLFGSLTTLASPVGLFIAGPAAEALGVNAWFVVCGIALVLIMLVLSRFRSLAALDETRADVAETNEPK